MKSRFQIPLREETMEDIKIFCRDQFENLRKIHKIFLKQISDMNPDNILNSMKNMTSSYEILLIQFCDQCQSEDLSDLGRFTMKMFLQLISCIKWVVRSFLKSSSNENSVIKEEENKELDELKEKRPEEFYRMKENSLFMANGIDKEIFKLSQNYTNENEELEKQIREVLSKKQKIQSIKESNNELILFDAVNNIYNKSEAFNSFIQMNTENFQKHFDNLKCQPFSTIKTHFEIDSAKRVNSVKHKITETVVHFLQKYQKKTELPKRNSRATQVYGNNDSNPEYLQAEVRDKDRNLRTLRMELNFERQRVKKLQALVREKVQELQIYESKIRSQIEGKTETNEVNKTQVKIEQKAKQQAENRQLLQQEEDTKITILKKKPSKLKIGKSNPKMKQKFHSQKNQDLLSEKNISQKLKLCQQEVVFQCTDRIKKDEPSIILSNKQIQIQIKSGKNLKIMQKTVVFGYRYEEEKETNKSKISLKTKKTLRKQSLINIINIGSANRKTAQMKKLLLSEVMKNQNDDQEQTTSNKRQKENILTDRYSRRKDKKILPFPDEKSQENGKNVFEKIYFNSLLSTKRKNPLQFMEKQIHEIKNKYFQVKIRIPTKKQTIQIEDFLSLYITPEKAFQCQFVCQNSVKYNFFQYEKKSEHSQVSQFVKVIFKLLQLLRKKSEVNYNMFKNFFRYPYSFFYQKDGKQIKKMCDFKGCLTYPELSTILERLISLHEQCSSLPCFHLKYFFEKFGLIFE